jgi:hypothetical protein
MFVLPTGKTTTILIGGAILLVVVSAAAIYARDVLGITHIAGVGYLQVLRIDREVSNLPVWYSSSLLLLGALSLAAVGGHARRRRIRIRWRGLAVLVLLMSIDEGVRIHERLGALLRNLTGVGLSWIIPAGLLVAGVVLITRQVWRTVTRDDRVRFAQATAVFAAGAVVMEIMHKVLSPEALGFAHYALVHGEEALEMCGAALLLRAAWLVLAPDGHMVLTIGPAPSAPVTRTTEPALTADDSRSPTAAMPRPIAFSVRLPNPSTSRGGDVAPSAR